MRALSPCLECGGRNVYSSRPIQASSEYGPNLLPGLGGFLSWAKMTAVVCADCGLARYYASEEARERLRGSKKWRRE